MLTDKTMVSLIRDVRRAFFWGMIRVVAAYPVYFPETCKVLKYRVVKFPKADRNVNEQQTQTGDVACDGGNLDDFIPRRSNFDRAVDVGISTDNADDPADGYASAAVNPEDVSVK